MRRWALYIKPWPKLANQDTTNTLTRRKLVEKQTIWDGTTHLRWWDLQAIGPNIKTIFEAPHETHCRTLEN
jgi:hypothetical protein